MAHLAVIDDGTQKVVQEWKGDGLQPVFPPGRTAIDVTALNYALGSLSNRHWNGTGFDALPAARIRTRREFLQLMTRAERERIKLAEILLSKSANPVDNALAAKISVAQEEFASAQYIDLDNPAVSDYLEGAKLVLVPSVWADTAAANARIAQILAGELPA